MRLFLASTLAQGRKVFRDTFNRADVSGIGRASDGSAWNTVRGSWSILSNKAKVADANYPMITQNMNVSNVQIDVYGTSQGSAAALWVTDSGNWWAVGLVQEPTDCNCTYYYNTYYTYVNSTCTAQNAGNYNGVNCTGSTTNTVCNSPAQLCSGTWNGYCNNYAYNTTNKSTRCSGSYNQGTCNQYYAYCNVYANQYTCTQYSASNLNAGNYYNYACQIQQTNYSGPFSSCQTCYPQYVRVLQSIGNTVSTITQWSIGTIASALRVKTNGSQLTVSAYDDTSQVSQIGSDLVYTPTGVTITPAFGLTVIPSSYNQGNTIDEIKISRS